MSGRIRFGIVIASVAAAAAVTWGGMTLAMLRMHWLAAHPHVAKALPLLPVLILPVVIILQRRRSGATLPA
jgi:hypothetical protein